MTTSRSEGGGQRRRIRPAPVAVQLAVLAGLAALPYVRLPAHPLYPDAERAVTRNTIVTGGSFRDLLLADFWGRKRGDVAATGSYRPAVSGTYWLQHRLTGTSAASLHLFDMLLHAAGAALVLLVLRRVAPARPFAFGAAMLFAVHPAVSEAVCSVVGRADLLAGTSFLGALLLHHRARTARAAAACEAAALALLAVALFSKEYAVAFPFLVLLADVLVPADGPGRTRRRRFGLLGLGLVGVYVGVRLAVLGSVGEVTMVVAADTPLAAWSVAHRLANAVWLLVPALRLLVVPVPLDHVYGIGTLPLVGGPADPRALAAAAIFLGAAAFGLRRARRHGDGAPLLALALFVVPLVLALNTVGVTVLLFAERYLYVPAAGLVLVVAWALARAARGPRARRWAWAALVGVAAVFAGLTSRRVQDWRSNEALAESAVRAHPRSAMALHELGMMRALAGDYEAAARLVRASLDVQGTRPGVWRNYALVLDEMGRRAEAVEAWTRAVDGTPPGMAPNRAWLLRLAEAQAASGQAEATIATLARAAGAYPGDAQIRRELGRALCEAVDARAAAGRDGEAAAYAARALDLGELDAEAAFRVGAALARGGDPGRAARAFSRARTLDGGILDRKADAAAALIESGRRAAAARLVDDLAAADPAHARLRALRSRLR